MNNPTLALYSQGITLERERPVLRAVQSFDRLRTNGIEEVRVGLIVILL